MKKEILISLEVNEKRVAILEDGKLEEFFIERSDAFKMFGNIYKGKVIRVLPSLNAAFLNTGEAREAFLPLTDVADDSL